MLCHLHVTTVDWFKIVRNINICQQEAKQQYVLYHASITYSDDESVSDSDFLRSASSDENGNVHDC